MTLCNKCHAKIHAPGPRHWRTDAKSQRNRQICEYAKLYPNFRLREIGAKFDVTKQRISIILKQANKWSGDKQEIIRCKSQLNGG